ncbi:peptide ABC transporter substrate-binding protein [Gammaproteobacteria bacterium LSUCC0057]|uniref:Peptide ABC transporter substrate-binding protein n=1 Tax=Gammaproteobacteria bacterium LSUCC0057 TaxID=2559237 RepID=A0A4Y8UK58_9GAMM|nr:peptide ABC transporter substrate-binding protein [Gammaproteobacteria bacterium LSUCC0057]
MSDHPQLLRRALLLLFAVATIVACSPAQPPSDSADDRTLTIGITQYPSTLHPNIDSMVAKSYLRGMTARALTIYNHDWQLQCSLCTELPTLENGLAKLQKTPDGEPGIAVTYTLPADLKWGDGTALTSGDFEFAWQVGRNPAVGVNNLEFYRSAYRFDIIDAQRFTLHLDRVTFGYNQLGDMYPLPRHLEAELYAADPAEYRHRTLYNSDVTRPGLYYGPYLITAAEQGASLTLARNPHWHGQSPYFDRIVVKAIQNTSALEANLLSGTIDMVAGELGLQLDQAISFAKRHGDKFNIVYKPGLQYEHIDLNLDNPILADLRVRQALLYGIDREEMNQRIFAGQQPQADGPVSPLDRVASSELKRYSYQPQRAAQLLEAAGWQMTDSGIRSNAQGQPLRLEIMSTAGNKTRELLQQVIQGQLLQIGVDLRINNQAPRVFFGQTTRERRFSALALFAWISAPESVPRSTLHSSEIPTAANNYAGQNYTGFRNAEMDQLLEQLETTLDFSQRLPLWHRLQQIYAEQLPVLPLFWRPNSYIYPLWLRGAKPTGHLDSSSNWIEEWHRQP